jgi:hypothetical protein
VIGLDLSGPIAVRKQQFRRMNSVPERSEVSQDLTRQLGWNGRDPNLPDGLRQAARGGGSGSQFAVEVSRNSVVGCGGFEDGLAWRGVEALPS